MILFINGPFGVGKTSVARLLVHKMPRSMLYDPEMIGAVLHRVLGPFGKAEDYQDYALWRPLLVGGASPEEGINTDAGDPYDGVEAGPFRPHHRRPSQDR
jgi:hypothetical protein